MGETRTLTFVFTDIEASTRMWEKDESAMLETLSAHDEIVRRHLGLKGDIFKHVGDGFLACFDSPREAVSAALLAQSELQSREWQPHPLKVRMAVLTGYAEHRDGDYFGRSLNRVSRLLSLAHGEQILVARTTYDLIGDNLPNGASFEPLGDYRLRDLENAESIYQLNAEGLRSGFPDLRTPVEKRHNLPLQVTSLVGRDKELAEVWEIVQRQRLVTLTGPGGIGKSRLSLHVAAELLDEFDDGVWFVELSPLREQDLVAQTFATVFGLREEVGRPIRESLVNHLRPLRALIVVDNCEHVLNGCAPIVDTIHRSCPGVHILASSREAISISGEHVYRVSGLPVPSNVDRTNPEDLIRNDAVRLFVERAELSQANFRLTEQNCGPVAEICAHLDGIPLAIELAAARVKAMSVEMISTRIEDRFRLLTGRDRVSAPRQQTLKAAIDWSYELLERSEKTVFDRLSVFAGGWTLALSEVVCSGEAPGGPVDPFDVLDLLTNLVEKSMAVYEENTGRYRLLETMRQYASEALAGTGETDVIRRKHAFAIADFAGEASQGLLGVDQESWLSKVEVEHDNLRVAIGWCSRPESSPEERQLGLSTAAKLWRFWDTRGFYEEGRTRLATLLASDLSLTSERGEALDAAGRLAYYQGEFQEAKRMFSDAADLFHSIQDRVAEHHALHGLAMALANCGDKEKSRPMLEACLQVFRDAKDWQGIARVLNALGFEALGQGDHERAEPLIREALEVRRRLNDVQGETIALYYLGACAVAREDLTLARSSFEQAYQMNKRLNYRRGMAINLIQLAAMDIIESNPAEAIGRLTEATEHALALNDQATIAGTLGPWAALSQSFGNEHARVVLLNALEVNRLHTGLFPTSVSSTSADDLVNLSQTYYEATALGRSLDCASAARYALQEVGSLARNRIESQTIIGT